MTMVKLKKETVSRLKDLKRYKRETYDEIIGKLIAMHTDELSNDDIKNIEAGLHDLKAGRVYSSQEVAKRLDIKG
ncbi:hypothetical protein J4475_03850 [Candidatus Woesearchaeota archaeon]|nr:hypothetical protein [Candidatus Woesearchaeota archaeon]